MSADLTDKESLTVLQCTWALSQLDIENDPDSFMRVFMYLRCRFLDQAQKRIAVLKNEQAAAMAEYLRLTREYKQAAKEHDAIKADRESQAMNEVSGGEQ